MTKLHWLVLLVTIISATAGAWLYRSLDYDFQTLEGEKYRWQQLQGNWVVVNYFAEWCAPCLREIPELNAFHDYSQAADNIKLFAISYDELDNQALTELKLKYDMGFALVRTDKVVTPNQKPQQLPATFIISPQGQVQKRLLGEVHSAELIEAINQLERL